MKFILITLLPLLFFQFCSSKKVKPSVDLNLTAEQIPSQQSWNSTVTFSDSGKIKAILWAGHLEKYEDKRETLMDQNIKVDFFNPNGKKTTTLTSKRGKVDEATNNLFAIDSVVVYNDSVTIKTEEMMWRDRDKKIVSDKFVTVISPKEKIQGYGFESDQSLNNYVIYNITYVTRSDTLR
jgi:LPS export ABC transporter protein LptC